MRPTWRTSLLFGVCLRLQSRQAWDLKHTIHRSLQGGTNTISSMSPAADPQCSQRADHWSLLTHAVVLSDASKATACAGLLVSMLPGTPDLWVPNTDSCRRPCPSDPRATGPIIAVPPAAQRFRGA
ncbi:hypothetical protein BD413DRAFT_182285 [Trametes elegans]|nr:hypothetical protein BD413DRAFT_182285 [Trametes elegans]